MITTLPSGNISVTPATQERPRLVTRETIEIFESNNPALKGIGSIMVDLGIWILDENSEAEIRDANRAKGRVSGMNTAKRNGDVSSRLLFAQRI